MLVDEAFLVPALPGDSGKFVQVRQTRSSLEKINRDAKTRGGMPSLLSRRTRFIIDRSKCFARPLSPPALPLGLVRCAVTKHRVDAEVCVVGFSCHWPALRCSPSRNPVLLKNPIRSCAMRFRPKSLTTELLFVLKG